MSNSTEHAEVELALIGMGKDATDEMNKLMHDNIIKIIEEFSSQGHSGFSASYAISHLTRLLEFKPLSPLTGEDDEWNEIDKDIRADGMWYQNKRYSAVFKDKDGRTYNSQGRVFRGRRGSYTTRGSSVDITFPYMVPEHPEYVNTKTILQKVIAWVRFRRWYS